MNEKSDIVSNAPLQLQGSECLRPNPMAGFWTMPVILLIMSSNDGRSSGLLLVWNTKKWLAFVHLLPFE